MRFLIYILAILYALSPYDLIPDFIFGGGWVDDLIVLGALCWYFFVYRKRGQSGPQTGWRYQYSDGQDQGRSQGTASSKGETGSREGAKGKDPYEVLGVQRGASSEDVRAAYRRLANQYHPDKVMHLGEEFKVLAEKRFKEIQQAYQQLIAESR